MVPKLVSAHIEFEMHCAGEQPFERNARFHSSKWSTQAKVDAPPKPDVLTRR
jgi:hypothetical protein